MPTNLRRDSDVGVFGTTGVGAHVPNYATQNIKQPPVSTTKQPPRRNLEADRMNAERVLGTTAQQAIDLTQTDSDDDTQTVLPVSNEEADVDARGARKRAKIATSSAAPAADSSGGEGCSTTLKTVSEEVVDMTRAAVVQALDVVNMSFTALKPKIKASKILLPPALYY